MSYSGLTEMVEVNMIKIHMGCMKATLSLKSGQKLPKCFNRGCAFHTKHWIPPKNLSKALIMELYLLSTCSSIQMNFKSILFPKDISTQFWLSTNSEPRNKIAEDTFLKEVEAPKRHRFIFRKKTTHEFTAASVSNDKCCEQAASIF